MVSGRQLAIPRLQRCRSFRRAYVVVAAACIMFAVLFGFLFGYSVFFVAFQEEFQSSATLTGWIGIIPISCTTLLAPLVKILVERFGSRLVAALGMAASSGGVIMTSFMPSIEPIIGTYGVVVGLGAGMVCVSTLDLIVMHFPRRNTMRATALVFSGSSFAILSLAPLHAFVIEKYGWRFLFRVFGSAIFAIGLPCALFFVEPSASPLDISDHDEESSETKIHLNQCSKIPARDENLLDDFNNGKDAKVSTSIIHLTSHPAEPGNNSETDSEESEDDEETCIQLSEREEEGYERSDKFSNNKKPSGVSQETPGGRREAKLCEASVQSFSKDSMVKKIATALTYPELWLICVAVIFGSVGDCFYYVNMISYLLSVGLTEQTGVTIISIMSFSRMGGNLLFVFLGEAIPFPRIFLLMIVYGIGACVILALVFVRSVIVLYCLAVVMGGVVTCGTTSVMFTLAPDFFGPVKCLETSAVIYFFNGVAYVISPMIGQSIDRTGSYRVALWALLGLYVTSVLLLILATVYQKYCAPARFVTFEIQRQKRAKKKALR